MAKEPGNNWLQTWILKAVGNKNDGVKKHKHLDEDDDDAGGNLFKEINELRKPEIDHNDADAVERAKYTDGFFGHIAGSKVFEFSTLGMISLNALAIGVDADYSARNHAAENLYEGPIFFIVVENTFAVYFTGEVLIRFCAYKKKCDVFCDAWFMFDSVLVTMMVVETWILPFIGSSGPLAQLSILRLLRLLRITRMAKIMRAVPEMMVIIKGMVAATRTVVCTGALLLLVLYTFSILFTDAYHEPLGMIDGEETTDAMAMFGTMGKSMFSLFIMGTVLDDVTAASNAIRASSNYWMLTAFVIFILISSFMMLNMLIGVLVEVVGATAEGEREKSIELNVREAIGEIFSRMDEDSNREISRGEFLAMRKDKNVMEALSDLEITGPHFHLYAELFFRPEETTGIMPNLNFDKLVSAILRMRPGSFVSALDFAAFAKSITGIHDRVKERVLRLEMLCQELAMETEGEVVSMPSLSNFNQFNGGADVGLGAPPPMLHIVDSGEDPTSPNKVLSFDGTPVANGTTNGQPAPNFTTSSGPKGLSDYDRDRLDRTMSAEIIEELQRRLGMADLDKTGVPFSMMDEELQNRLKQATEQQMTQEAQGFMMLGVPQDADDETVYV